MAELLRRHLFAIFEDDHPGPRAHQHNTVPGRAIYSSLAFLPLILTCYLFWRRVKEVRWHTIRHISWIRSLVYASYIVSIAFFITSIAISGVGIQTSGFCRTAIYFCIGFLFTGRLTTQLFLIERAHIANLDYLRRRDDPMWILSTACVGVFATFLLVWAFLNPVAYIANNDGRCRKGIPPAVVAPLEIYEAVTYAVLTGVFIVMLRRTRRTELFPSVPERFVTFGKTLNRLSHIGRPSSVKKGVDAHAVEVDSNLSGIVLPASTRPCKLRGLACKSLIGTILILGWGVINSTIFYVTGGRERVWLCFTQCNMDIFLSVCVLHWLTANPKELERSMRGTRPSITELPVFLRGDSIAEPEPAKLPISSFSSVV
ncbi:hypothetical protein KCU81_g1285, partial [Aureobasidium melanogenum]|uniref:Uncharacterized protein n=1 Tax=Aureobasidium melanogenum (strain CBS 110374) TaxID=1043003 RepID=A0A074W096_AURM1